MTKKWLKDSDVELRAKSPREEWFFISATASGAPKNHHFLLSPSNYGNVSEFLGPQPKKYIGMVSYQQIHHFHRLGMAWPELEGCDLAPSWRNWSCASKAKILGCEDCED